MPLRFDERPILVFWESTKSCLLACRHCRAEALAHPLPGQLSTPEAEAFIDSLVSFGRPYPVLILTGGDVLMRPDIFHLAGYARSRSIPVGMAPSVTPRLTAEARQQMQDIGVKTVSVSLDGSSPETHDNIRGIPGHFHQTVQALRDLVADGFEVQVNTVVMQQNVHQLPELVALFKDIGIHIWEVFFLIQVGRGRDADAVSELSPADCGDVCHFLYDASKYGITVRTVEAPFFRRVVAERKADQHDAATESHLAPGPLYQALSLQLTQRIGPSHTPPQAQTSGTRDGKGIVFVAHDGTVYPAGFLPVSLGNIRTQPLAEIYRNHPLMKDIRSARFTGRCGNCDFGDICGGSRSRAFAHTGNPLASDDACPYAAS